MAPQAKSMKDEIENKSENAINQNKDRDQLDRFAPVDAFQLPEIAAPFPHRAPPHHLSSG
jgi:hypothetical protein